ncbi:hypothetical protein GCM10010393_01030 [Streptomyces gobitricini]|uniref:Uncharacterized protein n=1 Tax=Streptomyces gobitricini TaxID=68211 RepID=A0ABP5Y4N9_9ACTN
MLPIGSVGMLMIQTIGAERAASDGVRGPAEQRLPERLRRCAGTGGMRAGVPPTGFTASRAVTAPAPR